jgi:hypothetical protein
MKTRIKIKEAVLDMEVESMKNTCINCFCVNKGDTGLITEVINRYEFKFKDQYGCKSIGCVQCCKEIKEVF